MTERKTIDLLRQKIEDAGAIVVGGASGMSAASGFKFYYMDDAVFRSVAGSLADKYGFRSMFDGLYERRMSRGEWWALILRTIKYVYDCYTGETYSDLAETLEGKNYYIVTTNQDAQFYRVFSPGRITRLQGDWRLFKCKRRCHDTVYNNREQVMELVPKIVNDVLPNNLIPRCPVCGGEMVPWIRSPEFLQGEFYNHEYDRYRSYLKSHMRDKVLFLELGVGMMTPMFIKEPFMNMVYQWPDAFYAPINPQHAFIPDEIADRSLAVEDDILFTFKELLGKDTSKIERIADKIFNPRKAY